MPAWDERVRRRTRVADGARLSLLRVVGPDEILQLVEHHRAVLEQLRINILPGSRSIFLFLFANLSLPLPPGSGPGYPFLLAPKSYALQASKTAIGRESPDGYRRLIKAIGNDPRAPSEWLVALGRVVGVGSMSQYPDQDRPKSNKISLYVGARLTKAASIACSGQIFVGSEPVDPAGPRLGRGVGDSGRWEC